MQQIEGRFRPEIQALRTVAVASVVLYHLWPHRLTGGYVGVDVFFAISGFLIIGHLLRETQRTGTVDVMSFWARRVRRLLPASIVVLLATAVAILVWVPQVLWVQFFKEIAASSLSMQNWLLAANSVDYLGADNAASPVQHFWSLSVEEQFYIAWPLVVLVVVALVRSRPNARLKRILFVLLAAITVASLVYCVVMTSLSSSTAYFSTVTRAWEFTLGGLLAFATAGRRRPNRVLAAAMSWGGLLAIGLSVLLFTAATPFPGYAAMLPVAGTLLVIAAGTPHIWWSPTQLARLGVVQWVGAVSYSLYLWHWPLLTIAPFALGHPLGLKSKLVVLAVAVVLAWLTKRFVEDPARTMQPLVRRRPFVSVVVGLAAAAVVVAGSGTVAVATDASVAAHTASVERAAAAQRACLGAGAMTDQSCRDPFTPTALTDPGVAATDIGKGVAVVDPCKQGLTETAVMVCRVGDTRDPEKVVALVGDSHAGQFLLPLAKYGAAHGIEFVTYLKSYCAGTGADDVAASGNGNPDVVHSCATWGRSVQKDILSSKDIQAVVFTNYTQAYTRAPAPWQSLTSGDFERVWKPLQEHGKQVVALRDIPNAAGVDVPQCVAQHLDQTDPCATPTDRAQLASTADPMLLGSKAVRGVHVVDLSDLFCTAGTCHTVIGGLIVYFGSHHMTATFAKTTAEAAGRAVDRAVPSR